MDDSDNKVMELADKLGMKDEFVKYCKENDVEPTSETLKEFLTSKGYTQSKLKEMLAAKSEDGGDMEESDDEEEDDSEKPKGGVTIAIMMGKSGKLPPAWN